MSSSNQRPANMRIPFRFAMRHIPLSPIHLPVCTGTLSAVVEVQSTSGFSWRGPSDLVRKTGPAVAPPRDHPPLLLADAICCACRGNRYSTQDAVLMGIMSY